MKRILFVSVLVAALAVPATAISAAQDQARSDFSAHAKRGGQPITFTVVFINGKPKKVRNFQYNDIPMTCEKNGPLEVSGSGIGTDASGPNGPAKIENKQFGKTYDVKANGGGKGTFRVGGELKMHNTRVVGSFRVKGNFNAIDARRCDSGRIDYIAE